MASLYGVFDAHREDNDFGSVNYCLESAPTIIGNSEPLPAHKRWILLQPEATENKVHYTSMLEKLKDPWESPNPMCGESRNIVVDRHVLSSTGVRSTIVEQFPGHMMVTYTTPHFGATQVRYRPSPRSSALHICVDEPISSQQISRGTLSPTAGRLCVWR